MLGERELDDLLAAVDDLEVSLRIRRAVQLDLEARSRSMPAGSSHREPVTARRQRDDRLGLLVELVLVDPEGDRLGRRQPELDRARLHDLNVGLQVRDFGTARFAHVVQRQLAVDACVHDIPRFGARPQHGFADDLAVGNAFLEAPGTSCSFFQRSTIGVLRMAYGPGLPSSETKRTRSSSSARVRMRRDPFGHQRLAVGLLVDVADRDGISLPVASLSVTWFLVCGRRRCRS